MHDDVCVTQCPAAGRRFDDDGLQISCWLYVESPDFGIYLASLPHFCKQLLKFPGFTRVVIIGNAFVPVRVGFVDIADFIESYDEEVSDRNNARVSRPRRPEAEIPARDRASLASAR